MQRMASNLAFEVMSSYLDEADIMVHEKLSVAKCRLISVDSAMIAQTAVYFCMSS